MSDYSAFETVFVSAIPQIYSQKYPTGDFSRRILVTDEAEDNFVITKTQVLISPDALTDGLQLLKFCQRIARACWDFDHLKERRAARLREEFQSQLTSVLLEIEKRWGLEGVDEMLLNSLTNGLAPIKERMEAND